MTESPHADVPTRAAGTHAELRSQLEEMRRDRQDSLDEPSRILVGEDDVTAPRLASLQRDLTEIDAALRRLADGDYGLCGKCGASIPAERLEIMPHARYCVSCQRGGERGSG